MTKIGLLVCADPRICKAGPTVRLTKGTWIIRVYGLRSSRILLRQNGSSAEVLDGDKIKLEKDLNVQVEFQHRGNEEYITIIAEKP